RKVTGIGGPDAGCTFWADAAAPAGDARSAAVPNTTTAHEIARQRRRRRMGLLTSRPPAAQQTSLIAARTPRLVVRGAEVRGRSAATGAAERTVTKCTGSNAFD